MIRVIIFAAMRNHQCRPKPAINLHQLLPFRHAIHQLSIGRSEPKQLGPQHSRRSARLAATNLAKILNLLPRRHSLVPPTHHTDPNRSEEHTSELQSRVDLSYD